MNNANQLTGRVLDVSGAAISGADIVALSGEHFQRHPIDVVLSEGNGLYEDANCAVTDDKGRFEIFGSLEQNAALSISVIAKGYAPLRMPHEWFPEEPSFDLGNLILYKGHSISGVVVDDTGNPLDDVQVLMAIERGVPGCLQSYPGRGIPLTRTDSSGRFTAEGLLPGRWFFIFDKPEYRVAEAQGNLFNNPTPGELRITLGRGRSISGRVTKIPAEIDGPLVVEARPIRRGVDYCKQFPSRARPRRSLVEADGSFLIEGLNEEEFKPKIQPGRMLGFHPEWTTDPGKLDVWLVVGRTVEPNRRLIEMPEFQSCRVEAGTTDVELPWVGKANLSARVVNKAGSPIEGFIAELRYESGFGPKVDAQKPKILPAGRIEIRDYAFWDMHLSLWTPARKIWLAIQGAVGINGKTVEIQDQLVGGERSDIGDIVLCEIEENDEEVEQTTPKPNETEHPASERCDVTVIIRESDRPVIGAKLELSRTEQYTQDVERAEAVTQGYTDDRGRFRFRNIPVGEVVVHVKHDDRHMVNRRTIHVESKMDPVDWLLDNNTISGQLVDPEGNAHAYKRIGIRTDVDGYCQRNSDGITYENGRGGLNWFWSNQAVHEAWTDADGHFHLRGLVADIPISLYTRHGEIKDVELFLDSLTQGEQRYGVKFVAELSGKTGWRGSAN